MPRQQDPSQAQHYLALDALRGVAAIMVLCYHIGEAFATSPLDQVINHGYLAVDFFFLLSGFVMSYAYDERWRSMSIGNFFARRLIRLQPMLVVGAIWGGVMFYTQATPTQPLHLVPWTNLALAVVMNILLIPALPSCDIRGYTEIFPLNGPTWSLFFEYIASILYACLLRHLSPRALGVLLLGLAITLGYEAYVHSPWAYLGAGWSFADGGFWGGMARVSFSFTAGLLLARTFKPYKLRHGFWVGASLLIVLLAMPRLGGEIAGWINASYELLCCIVAFPLIVCLGASVSDISPQTSKIYRYLGDISYPLYIVHYPFIYLYIAWLRSNELSTLDKSLGAIALVVVSLLLAHLLLKAYDIPIRQKLSKYVLRRSH